ncbi:DUF547 domain-containing protein [Chitinophaga sp. GCM10012297]|uniref:DUF547 domain-containing protein n=1 Tax=Chitinophaga chungangae TaxID=2821488 RepID=A0ABS3YEI4_9BACT|nr:DUF547 domain-containing protein [Chitinophaga chungangae]MBO9153073.1 DUF547 domain-containing protein [Chitinophaga chungangae]
MQHLIKPYLVCYSVLSSHEYIHQAQDALVPLSQELLFAARTGNPVVAQLQALATVDRNELLRQLDTDRLKMTFWINVYNAAVQIALEGNSTLFENRAAFFRKNIITVAGHPLSLDDIEHGILRRSLLRLRAGRLLPNGFEKMFRVTRLDPRIHFALNYGARSCPPIEYYDDARIDEQLDLAMKSHLQETRQTPGAIFLPAFMNWYRGDFGGKKGMRRILQKLGLPEFEAIRFQRFDWSLFPHNYRE